MWICPVRATSHLARPVCFSSVTCSLATTSTVSLTVVILVAAHVLALVYWIYSLATEKQP
ncbi:hypothetical protein CsSME_00017143 [Camellia sinensis var. sinensis]